MIKITNKYNIGETVYYIEYNSSESSIRFRKGKIESIRTLIDEKQEYLPHYYIRGCFGVLEENTIFRNLDDAFKKIDDSIKKSYREMESERLREKLL